MLNVAIYLGLVFGCAALCAFSCTFLFNVGDRQRRLRLQKDSRTGTYTTTTVVKGGAGSHELERIIESGESRLPESSRPNTARCGTCGNLPPAVPGLGPQAGMDRSSLGEGSRKSIGITKQQSACGAGGTEFSPRMGEPAL